MNTPPRTIYVDRQEATDFLRDILLQHSFPESKATVCAETFVTNSLEGIYTHGISRFAKFVSFLRKGIVDSMADPSFVHATGGLEQWEGNSGIGITNAIHSMQRAVHLADRFGIGCVALANTNHWMRAGTYAALAARNGYAGLCWSNTLQNTAAWGAIDPRLGNNPLAIGIPRGSDDPVLLDIAMSQYSYGALDQYRMNDEMLPVPGGFDESGKLSSDPSAILKTRRTLPIGYWKGSGLSLLLDMLAAILSGGLSVADISKQVDETRLSQVFIAFKLDTLNRGKAIEQALHAIVTDYKTARPVDDDKPLRTPGERVTRTRQENIEKGIPVAEHIWNEIVALRRV
jgi:3-dehydro-L-gulonate 2-dehydrogenase